jgi:transcriptional regulator with XRE-family HTH domain
MAIPPLAVQLSEVPVDSVSPRNSSLSQHVDDYVGARIGLRRTLLGLTQEDLAAPLAISYQQVQKYETGTNRVSAGRLFELANVLDTGISYFFDDLDPTVTGKDLLHGGRNRIAIDLVRNFLDIASEDQRAALANLVRTLRSHDDPKKLSPA